MVDARKNAFETAVDTVPPTSTAESSHETVIPLFEEELQVARRVVSTGRVQVSRTTQTHEHLVDELLEREQVEVERVAINQPIDRMPSVREEGDSLIFPVVEEVVKIERLLVLKEEVRIRRVKGTERYQERVTLRKQEAVVTRLPIDENSADQANHRNVSDAKENV